MHHHSRNRERTLNLSILILSGSGKVPRVELHVLWCHSVNFFKFHSCERTP
eukprot:gene1238-gene983